jgi:hypothetical protein
LFKHIVSCFSVLFWIIVGLIDLGHITLKKFDRNPGKQFCHSCHCDSITAEKNPTAVGAGMEIIP